MGFDFQQLTAAGAPRQGPLRLVRKLIVIAFGVVQLILVARIARDLGYLPDAIPADLVVKLSDAVAAPVKGIAGSMLGAGVGGGGTNGAGGSALNAVMLAALAGWSLVEGVVWSVLGRFM